MNQQQQQQDVEILLQIPGKEWPSENGAAAVLAKIYKEIIDQQQAIMLVEARRLARAVALTHEIKNPDGTNYLSEVTVLDPTHEYSHDKRCFVRTTTYMVNAPETTLKYQPAIVRDAILELRAKNTPPKDKLKAV